jgi:hypothetical protein
MPPKPMFRTVICCWIAVSDTFPIWPSLTTWTNVATVALKFGAPLPFADAGTS